MVVGVSFVPIIIFLGLDLFRRPRVWLRGFKKRFLTSWVEYLPDPSMVDKSRRKTNAQMEALIQETLTEAAKNKRE